MWASVYPACWVIRPIWWPLQKSYFFINWKFILTNWSVHYVTKSRHSSFDYFNFYSGMPGAIPGWNSLGGPYLPHLPYLEFRRTIRAYTFPICGDLGTTLMYITLLSAERKYSVKALQQGSDRRHRPIPRMFISSSFPEEYSCLPISQ